MTATSDIIDQLVALAAKMNSAERTWVAMMSSRQATGPGFTGREIAFMQQKLAAVAAR